MFSMLPPNGWTFSKVEMIPGVERIGHADVLVELSSCTDNKCRLCILNHSRIFERNQLVLFFPASEAERRQTHQVAFYLTLPSLRRASCISWHQSRGSVWCRCLPSTLRASETLQQLNRTICSQVSGGTKREIILHLRLSLCHQEKNTYCWQSQDQMWLV